MKKLTKAQFLKDVLHEILALKKLATKEELEKLNFAYFQPTSREECIYGQMTGNCENPRAKLLMDAACIRVTNTNINGQDGTYALEGKSIEDSIKLELINGKNTGQGWKGDYTRNWTHLSALEGYIALTNANNKGVIQFLKGEITLKELKL